MHQPSAFTSIVKRDLLLSFRHRERLVNPLLFFLLIVSLFPLGIGSESKILQTIGPGVIWVAALLATLMSLDSLFRDDYDDGSLEQLLLSPQPLVVIVLAKISAYWLVTSLPLIILSPLLGTLFALSGEAIGILALTLLLGTPTLSFIGAIGAALTVGIKNNGALLSLVVLPLYIPVLIFATSAVSVAASELPISGQMYILGALLALSASLAPFAVAAGLRITSN